MSIDDIPTAERAKLNESFNQGLIGFFFYFVLLSLPFTGMAISLGLIIPAVAVLVVVPVVFVRWLRRHSRREMLAFTESEASKRAAAAQAYRNHLAQFPEVLYANLAALAEALAAAEQGLSANLYESFWDSVDDSYKAAQRLARCIHAELENIESFASTLAGREHNFPALMCSLDTTTFKRLVRRYNDLLNRVERDKPMIEIFELRRHRSPYAPSFRSLREVSQRADADLHRFAKVMQVQVSG